MHIFLGLMNLELIALIVTLCPVCLCALMRILHTAFISEESVP